MRTIVRTLAVMLTVFVRVAFATDYHAGSLDIAGSRATTKGASVAAGYLTIRNTGTTADRLVGAPRMPPPSSRCREIASCAPARGTQNEPDDV